MCDTSGHGHSRGLAVPGLSAACGGAVPFTGPWPLNNCRMVRFKWRAWQLAADLRFWNKALRARNLSVLDSAWHCGGCIAVLRPFKGYLKGVLLCSNISFSTFECKRNVVLIKEYRLRWCELFLW